MSEKGKLTGHHVLFMFLAFFGVMLTVNAYFLFVALKSFPGEQVLNPYETGLKQNEIIAQQEKEAELGWQVELGFVKQESGEPKLVSIWRDRDGSPLGELIVEATLVRTTTEDGRRDLILEQDGTSRYTSLLDGLGLGLWNTELTATNAAGDTFTAKRELTWFGWSAKADILAAENGMAELRVIWTDKNGTPLDDLMVTARIEETDNLIALDADETAGHYSADLGALNAGDLNIEILARRGQDEKDSAFETLTWQP